MSLGHGASIVRDGLMLHIDAANVKSYPGSGTTVSNLMYENPSSVTIDGDSFEYISDSNAATLGYTFGPTDVKGESDLSSTGCSGLMTFQEAVEWVHSFGARLPTVDEIKRGAASGSGCGYDAELIWTADGANSAGTQHYVIHGNTATYGDVITPRDVNSTAYVRYVADVNTNRSDPVTPISDYLRSILENYYSTTYITTPGSFILTLGEEQSNIQLNNGVITGSNYFEFDGTNDYISIGKSFLRNSGDFGTGNINYSLEAWIYPAANPGELLAGSSIIGHASEFGFGMQLNYTSNKLLINFGARSNSNFNSVSSLNLNNWYHIVCVREVGVENRIYINAVKDSTFTISELDVTNTASEIQIGYAAGRITQYFNGKIGLVRAYKTALSDFEVKQNFEAMRGRYGI